MPYTISDAAMADWQTQLGYAQTAWALHLAHSSDTIYRQNMCKHLNACQLLLANGIVDVSTSEVVASDTFGGSGNVSGTTPQSGGIAKNP